MFHFIDIDVVLKFKFFLSFLLNAIHGDSHSRCRNKSWRCIRWPFSKIYISWNYAFTHIARTTASRRNIIENLHTCQTEIKKTCRILLPMPSQAKSMEVRLRNIGQVSKKVKRYCDRNCRLDPQIACTTRKGDTIFCIFTFTHAIRTPHTSTIVEMARVPINSKYKFFYETRLRSTSFLYYSVFCTFLFSNV